MKFIVDENLGPSMSNWLRSQNFDVYCVLSDNPSIEDIDILRLANEENRVIITNDKDFGELIFKNQIPCKGLVLLRLQDNSLLGRINAVKNLLENYKDVINSDNFIVAGDEIVRIKRFS